MTKNQKNKHYNMKPLMYIVQPDNQDINVNMQSFVVKKAKPKDVVVEDNQLKGNIQVKTLVKEEDTEEETSKETQMEVNNRLEENVLQDSHSLQADKDDHEQDSNQEQDQEQTVKQYRKQRKPITQMNIAEKIEFFKNLPKNMPRTLCQIETTEETYRGVIMTEEDKIVTIRSLTHAKPIDLPLENIQSINLLGF
ncbi:CotO family spore coat protein [Metabacillus litoralis]|uniref:CotO family spore coat protein n=1 Tax=Metabacillus litoralis TaxID=152268 RepID=UPI001CFDB0CC|nr:CotO family spore coat protein [Metabacillus litoralis]